MNDKLRKFEKESKLEIFGLGARREIWERALEKYAELIVRECAQHALDFNNNNQSLPDKVLRGNLHRVSDYIKDRMGSGNGKE